MSQNQHAQLQPDTTGLTKILNALILSLERHYLTSRIVWTLIFVALLNYFLLYGVLYCRQLDVFQFLGDVSPLIRERDIQAHQLT